MLKETHTLPLPDGGIYAEVHGSGDAVPLLTLHGGPAAGSQYLSSLARLTDGGRQVILYDQLGCGRSDKPDDPSLWTAARYAAEVQQVRDALGLERVHLLGQSWGGMLAIEYMLGRPSGVVSLVFADTTASIPQATDGLLRLRSELPPEARAALDEADRTGRRDDPAYQAALITFYQRHVCRLPSWPQEMFQMAENMDGNPVYSHMWGPDELSPSGSLATWDRRDRLAEITVPALVLTGRYGELVPECSQSLDAGLLDSQLVLLPECSHLPHLEEPEQWFGAVATFLEEAEARAS
ncbi:proline iminopeptidase-family hydrolase [Streptomyces sp. NPDC048248]|uniref:proline iminopeptidase-family hydrolase n=1 Tax=Streptomyces sp. NPDC048248 TaxID=3365523 RepID=UPI0037190948